MSLRVADGTQIVRSEGHRETKRNLSTAFAARGDLARELVEAVPESAPDDPVRARPPELSRSQPFDRLPGGAVAAAPNLD
jgi:hypothetical protein